MIAFIFAVLNALPTVIKAGQDALTLIEHAQGALAQMRAEGRAPTDAEWQALGDTIDGLMAQLKD